MASEQRTTMVRQSLLDSLIDDHPGRSRDQEMTQSQAIKAIRESVCRDLENLLNTRWRPLQVPSEHKELTDSLVNYGIPDFSKARDPMDYWELCELVRQSIVNFEPRLQQVRVEPITEGESLSRQLQFRIDAVLRVDPLTDPIAFSSVLEPSTGSFNVERVSR